MIATDAQLDLVRAALLSRPRSIAELAAVLDVATQRGRDSREALADAAEDALAYLRAEAVPAEEEQLQALAIRERLGTLVGWPDGQAQGEAVFRSIRWRLPSCGGRLP